MIWHSTVRNSNICWAFNFGQQDPLVRSGQERKLDSRPAAQPPPPHPCPPDSRCETEMSLTPRVTPLTLYMTCTCKCGGKLGNHPLQSVLRIRDVYPGSRILMFTHPGLFVNYFSFDELKKQIWDPGSGIGCLLTPGSGIGLFRIPDLRSRIPNSYFW